MKPEQLLFNFLLVVLSFFTLFSLKMPLKKRRLGDEYNLGVRQTLAIATSLAFALYASCYSNNWYFLGSIISIEICVFNAYAGLKEEIIKL